MLGDKPCKEFFAKLFGNSCVAKFKSTVGGFAKSTSLGALYRVQTKTFIHLI